MALWKFSGLFVVCFKRNEWIDSLWLNVVEDRVYNIYSSILREGSFREGCLMIIHCFPVDKPQECIPAMNSQSPWVWFYFPCCKSDLSFQDCWLGTRGSPIHYGIQHSLYNILGESVSWILNIYSISTSIRSSHTMQCCSYTKQASMGVIYLLGFLISRF